MIKVDKALIRRLTDAQAVHAAELLMSRHWQVSDDGWDYCQAATNLAHIMLHIDYNDDIQRLDQLLNMKGNGNGESLEDFACDGICSAFYDLNPPSLKDDDDGEDTGSDKEAATPGS